MVWERWIKQLKKDKVVIIIKSIIEKTTLNIWKRGSCILT